MQSSRTPALPFVLGAAGAALALIGFVASRPHDGAARTPASGPAGLGGSAPLTRVVSGAVESPPSFRVAGLMVHSDVRPSMSGGEELAFFGTFSRTRLAVELVLPEGGLFDLDRGRSSLTTFADDLGTDLLDPSDPFGPIEMSPRLGADGRSLVFVLGSDGSPAAEASRLRAEGTLVVRVSEAKATYETETIPLAVGQSFELGPLSFEITESEASQWNEGAWSTTVRTRQDPSAILSWSLVTPDGQTRVWREGFSMQGGGVWSRSLECDERVELGRIRIEAWKDPRARELPFSVEAGLGLH